MNEKPTSSEGQLRSQDDLRTIRIGARRASQSVPSANDGQKGNTLLGEVRVKVTLTNAGDEALLRRGLLKADKIRHYEADALVDTGAIRSVLPIYVVQTLGLAIVGKTQATYLNDAVDIAEGVGIDIDGRRTTEETLVRGSEVVIGQTVLASLDLLVDCINHRLIPNPAHPDQPVIKIKYLVETSGQSFAVHP